MQTFKVGSNSFVKYEDEYFPGSVENKDKGCYEISTNNTFRWPEKLIKFGMELMRLWKL